MGYLFQLVCRSFQKALRFQNNFIERFTAKGSWKTEDMRRTWWRRQWHATPALLPGKSYGQRSLVGCSPWGRYESDTTERLHSHFSLSCIGGRNGNPLQYSCLENPRDGGDWWDAIYGVTQSQTRLKRLSSSSSSTWTEVSRPDTAPTAPLHPPLPEHSCSTPSLSQLPLHLEEIIKQLPVKVKPSQVTGSPP